ncbi:MAG: hypothetical protein GTO45_25060 [Candidatus Aminicenantes bacterium]|nr:hypothetical protein [Candidatus Aminicenantes bacterium]NIN88040.1 hypothetical protein [Candidatus Aminicenantes bacterium]NIO84356.1 hypothetical protein [Candidatus Aminicenantes bacterium]NIQ70315.1 hypothetical protein [Candidatus Aminicenantes bacterium]
MSNVETRPQTNQKVNNKGKETSKRTQGNKSKSRPIYASVDQTLHLQQTIGNHAVQRMIKSGALQLDDGRMQKGDKYPTEVAELAQRVQMSKVENKLPEGRCNALQFVKNLTPKTHVEVNDKGGRWYGQIVKVLNGRYEIRIGGTDTTKIVEEGSVTLHPTRIAMGLGAVIEPEKYVGMGKFDRSNGKMKTDDLYNCIAVAAYHETSGFASFTHYNTVGAFTYEDTGEEDKEGEWIYQMEINIESLNKLKINLLQTLGEDSDIDFYIVLGVVWKDSEDKKIQRMKTELIRGLNEVFENPQMNTDGKLTADWDPIGDFPVLW